jgi:hypothetical protein
MKPLQLSPVNQLPCFPSTELIVLFIEKHEVARAGEFFQFRTFSQKRAFSSSTTQSSCFKRPGVYDPGF